MGKYIKKVNIEHCVVIFVEGATEKSFYRRFVQYCNKSDNKKVIIKNVEGIGNYQLKIISIIKNEVKVKFPKTDFSVALCYDTDVFEYSPKPPINWTQIEKKIRKECKINNILHIKAEKMIEDWFIIDLKGLCKYLNYSRVPSSIKGNSGLEKIRKLFRDKNKIYLKGSYCDKFLDFLDFNLLCNVLKDTLKPLKDLIEK